MPASRIKFAFKVRCVTVLACLWRPIRRRWSKSHKPGIIFRDFVMDLFNGSLIAPLLLLIGSPFSRELLEEALRANMVLFAACALVALYFIFREFNKE